MNLNPKPLLALVASGFLLVALSSTASAAGAEVIGNKPLPPAVYQKWPDLAPVGNDTNRVYQRWANGDDEMFFAGNTAGLNEALQNFTSVKTDAHEVILLPGPVAVSSFSGSKTFDYDWSLKINSGVSSLMRQGKGGQAWSKSPQLTVYITEGGDIDLSQLHIPNGITVLELSDLRKRYTDAIQNSGDSAVRGWSANQLAYLDPYSPASVAVVTNLLSDPDEWVRLNAANALAGFGKTATSALPQLRQIASTADDELKDRLETAIATIEAASEVTTSSTRRKRSAALENISLFCKSLAPKTGN